MRRSVSSKDIATFGKLNMVYNHIRMIEAQQNRTEYKCLGSGKCCKIGLTIPLAECANIAFNLRQQYYLYLEDKGEEYANEWMQSVVDSLKERMYDETWKMGGESERHCAFYKGGCTIYGYRPMVCRTFGTITTVDDYCPRARNAYGSIDYFSGTPIQNIVKNFQDLLKEYAQGKDPGYDMTLYMPLGVLSFLLSTEELQELQKNTDPKFWMAIDGWFNYRVQYIKEHGHEVDYLHEQAVSVGRKITFNDDIDNKS
jgi:Fe-S-cluster containining protein